MSKFGTSISFQNVLDDLKTKLPPGSSVIGHKLIGDELFVEWENPRLVTNYLHAFPFPIEHLDGELPAGVIVKDEAKPPVVPKHVDKTHFRGKKVRG
jgi:hypothetical protein